MRKWVITIFAFFTLCVFVNTSAWALFDPYTFLNYLQDLETALNTAEQVKQEAQMLKYEAQNAGHVSDYQWRNTLTLLQEMDQVSRQGQALSYSAAQVDTEFRQKYPDYSSSRSANQSYREAYHDWNATTLGTLQNTLSASGVEANNLQHEQSYLNQLKMQGQTAQGRMQVMQVSTELAAENVNQLQSLKRLMMAQANAQDAYLAYRVSKDSYREQSLQAITQKTHANFPVYKNNDHFGKIEMK